MVNGKRPRDRDDSRHRSYHPRRRSDSRPRRHQQRHYHDDHRDRDRDRRHYSPTRRGDSRHKKQQPTYTTKRRKDSVSSVRDDRRRDSSRGSRSSRGSSPHSDSEGSSVNDEIGHFDGQPDDKITDRFTIIDEMGKGTFGKVFKCKDSKYQDIVAIKVVRSVPRYIKSAEIEAKICDDIFEKMQTYPSKTMCVKMFSHFHFRDHYVMVYEPLGMSLYDVIKKNDYKRLPLSMVANIAKQLLEAMAFLKNMNLIHTDLKLENVLFVHTSMEMKTVYHKGKAYDVMIPINNRVKLIDFGGATYDNDPDKSTIINTRQYRGPEVTLELGWSFPSDIWSVGCIIAEIYCGDLLFQTHEEREHLALIEKLCGNFPSYMIDKSKVSRKYFDRYGKVDTHDLSEDSKSFINECLSFHEFCSLSEEDQYSGIRELLEHLLIIDPSKRWDAQRALHESTFIQHATISTSTTTTTSTS